jgi:hypothetical protein
MKVVEIVTFDGSIRHAGVERDDRRFRDCSGAILLFALGRGGIAIAFNAAITTAATGRLFLVTF